MPTQNPFERNIFPEDSKSLRKSLGGFVNFDFLQSFKPSIKLPNWSFDKKLKDSESQVYATSKKAALKESELVKNITEKSDQEFKLLQNWFSNKISGLNKGLRSKKKQEPVKPETKNDQFQALKQDLKTKNEAPKPITGSAVVDKVSEVSEVNDAKPFTVAKTPEFSLPKFEMSTLLASDTPVVQSLPSSVDSPVSTPVLNQDQKSETKITSKKPYHFEIPKLKLPQLPKLNLPSFFGKSKITKTSIKPTATTPVTVLPKENLPAVSNIQTIIPKDIYRSLRRLQNGVYLIVILMVVQTGLILNKGGFNLELPGSNSRAQNLQTISALPSASQPGNRVITDFNTNIGIADAGHSLRIQKAQIDLRNPSNCSTPLVPPLENGCGFSILPSALGIPNRGVLYRNIQFEGSLGENGRLALDLKNYDRGALDKEIGTITKATFSKKTILPENIDSTTGIFVRFWSSGGANMVITKILVEYSDVGNLRPVSGKVSPDLAKEDATGIIYQDRDENKLFDPKVDKKWECQPNFSGVGQVKFNENGNFILERDDGCFVDVKPDSWYTYEKKNVLPPGKWLLIIDGKSLVYNFEIKPDDKQVIADLTK